MKETNKLIKKLMSLLNSLSDNELRKLRVLLSSPVSDKILIETIDNLLKFRAISINGDREILEIHRSNISEGTMKQEAHSSIKNEKMLMNLSDFLNDRNVFPTTKDVINAVNANFGFDIEYEDFYKRGRRDLVNKYVKLISRMPRKEKIFKINQFVSGFAKKDIEMDSYKELFGILIGNGNE